AEKSSHANGVGYFGNAGTERSHCFACKYLGTAAPRSSPALLLLQSRTEMSVGLLVCSRRWPSRVGPSVGRIPAADSKNGVRFTSNEPGPTKRDGRNQVHGLSGRLVPALQLGPHRVSLLGRQAGDDFGRGLAFLFAHDQVAAVPLAQPEHVAADRKQGSECPFEGMRQRVGDTFPDGSWR